MLNLVTNSNPFYPNQPYQDRSPNGFSNTVSSTLRLSTPKEYGAKPCKICWPSFLLAITDYCIKICHAKKYVPWRSKNSTLLPITPPLKRGGGRCYMILKALASLYLSGLSFFVQTISPNMTPWS